MMLLSVFVGAWVGWIIGSGRRGWSMTIRVGGGFIVGVLAAVGVLMMGETARRLQEPVAVANAVPSLGLGADDFRRNYNAVVKNPSYQLPAIKVQQGDELDSFAVDITPRVALSGMLNKGDHSLRQVWVVSTNNGTQDEAVVQVLVMWGAVMAVQPQRNGDEAVLHLRDMLRETLDNPPAQAVHRYEGNMRLSMTMPGQNQGLWFVLAQK